MPAVCSLCSRTDRALIDERIVAGRSYRSIGVEFGTTKDAVGRHATAHLGQRLSGHAAKSKDAVRKRTQRKIDAIVARKVSLASPEAHLALHEQRYAEVDEIFQEARTVKDNRLALAADKARGEIAGDAARLQGFEKSGSPLVNIQFQRLEVAIGKMTDEQLDAALAAIAAGETPDIPGFDAKTLEGEVVTCSTS